jgi:hypothetical protein
MKRTVIVRLVALIIAAWVSLATSGHAQLTPITAGPTFGSDDWNTATLTPSSIIPVGGGTTVAQCPWINTGLADLGYVLSNGWNISWANDGTWVQNVVTVNQYYAWVKNEPSVVAPNGTNYPGRAKYQNTDAGGAIFGLTYNPGANNPTNVHFIQAYEESFNGGSFTFHLDNGGTAAWNAGLPWYDWQGAAGGPGTANGGTSPTNNAIGSWFLDTPADFEAATYAAPSGLGEEKLTNSVVQFQVVVAVDNTVGGTNNVTLYGGDWWGYTYSNSDTIPEPSTFLLVAFGILGMVRLWRRRARAG